MMMKINITLCIIICFQLINCTAPKKTSTSHFSVIKQIQIDHENGNISTDDYYTFLTYSVFAQDLLPNNYKGKIGPRDATPIIRKVKRAYPTLSPETQKHLMQWIKPLPPKPLKPEVKP
ncbi:MAG: hypothetical protein QF852_02180 [Candidatus Marinimicrobia bacterium]|nr:hypothetical protein [Candidatus Neomarinimicrobiota bacterium]